jgi:3-oxoadipate enol-lactonase
MMRIGSEFLRKLTTRRSEGDSKRWRDESQPAVVQNVAERGRRLRKLAHGGLLMQRRLPSTSFRRASRRNGVRGFVGPDSARISYLTGSSSQSGTTETVLLIHGSGMSAHSWTEQLRSLGRALRVIAIDLPGHGASDPTSEATVDNYADAARRLLDALGTAGPVFVAGHSLGGGVALALAALHPDRVKGLVLISSCAKLPQNNGAIEGFLGFLPPPVRRFFVFSTARKILFPVGASRRAVRLALKDLHSCPPETLRKDVAAAKAMDLEAAAHDLRVPALILCGTQDRLTPVALSQRLSELIPGSRLQLVEAAGHMLPLEAPGRVNAEIRVFVDSVVGCNVPQPLAVGDGANRAIIRRLINKALALCRRKPSSETTCTAPLSA